jgi:branched chain amino acid efflux pump
VLWTAVIAAAVGCYLLKLSGVALPESVLAHPRVQRVGALLPVAMLAALVVTQLLDGRGRYSLDWHVLAGVLGGTVALLLRQGVLTVFVVAVVVTAVLRAVA